MENEKMTRFKIAVALSEINNFNAAKRDEICTKAIELLTSENAQLAAPASVHIVQEVVDLGSHIVSVHATEKAAKDEAARLQAEYQAKYGRAHEIFFYATYAIVAQLAAPAAPQGEGK